MIFSNFLQLFEAKSDKEKVKRKRKKKDDDEKDKDKTAKKLSSNSSASNTTSETEITKKRRRKDKEKGKEKAAKVKQEEIVDVEEDDDDDDDDELCAAGKCTRPQGDEVGWVQCDVCEKWYHLACVGLSPEKAEAMDSYNCQQCLTGASSSTNVAAGGTPTAASPESENIDVDGTTPSATTPTSPSPPVCIDEVQGSEAVQSDKNVESTATKAVRPVTMIDLCSDTEDMDAE